MPRYIDVESKDFPVKALVGSSIFAAGWNDCIDTVMGMPTADVQEVKHGKWIESPYGAFCSVCRMDANVDNLYGGYYDSDFCPHCGAKMDRRGEEK